MILLVDLDEVFCDFTFGALRAHKWTKERLESTRIPGEWDLAKIMGISLDEFWAPIHRLEPAFWLGLPELPWARQMLQMLNKQDSEWYIVSAPSRDPDCYGAKIKWCRRFFGTSIPDPILTPNKHLFANPNSVLIDDNEANILTFNACGGTGILFPSKGNKYHHLSYNPVPFVEELLDALKV